MLKRIQFFSLVLLLGTQIVIGFLVTPLIFKYVHEQVESLNIAKNIGMNHIVLIKSTNLADNISGNIAGHLFHYVSYISILMILILLFIDNQVKISSFYDVNSKKNNTKKYLLISSLFLIFINEFFITRVVRSLKLNKSNWIHNIIGGDFMIWHLVSKYIFISVVIICFTYALFWIKDNIIHPV